MPKSCSDQTANLFLVIHRQYTINTIIKMLYKYLLNYLFLHEIEAHGEQGHSEHAVAQGEHHHGKGFWVRLESYTYHWLNFTEKKI